MTQDEIISMAKECGVHEYGPLTRNWSFELSQFERFAALVAAHEREKQAEQEPVAWGYFDSLGAFIDALNRQHGAYQTPLYAAPVQQEEQEPVGTVGQLFDDHVIAKSGLDKNRMVYLAPARTKDLTDDEIDEIFETNRTVGRLLRREIARAVIAADREKNK